MKNKMIALWLVLAVVVSMLTACSGGAEEEESVSSTETAATEVAIETTTEEGDEVAETEPQDIADITISYWSLSKVPAEADDVEAAINAITEKEIGVRVNLNVMDVGSYIPNGAMTNGVANGEDFDLVLTAPAASGHFLAMSNNGMLLPLDDLLAEYGQDLLATIPEQFLQATKREGRTLAIPEFGNKVKNMYWMVRKSVAEGAGIDVAAIKTIDDLEAALLKIKEAVPEMIALGGGARTVNLGYPGYTFATGDSAVTYDNLGESTAVAAVVDFADESMTAYSRYDADHYKAVVERLKAWYELGLLDKDIATDNATTIPLTDKPNVASQIYVGQFNLAETLVKDDEVEIVKIADGAIGTGVVLQFTWALPVSCDEPEAAMKFMNLLFTDERIVNLIDYGVEGQHYVKNADGTIGFPDGITAETSGYYMGGITELVGNAYLAYTWQGGDVNKKAREIEEMENAIYSPLLGFNFDTSKVADIYAQLASIANDEYGPALNSGSYPDGYYEEFLEKMKAAGLDEYIAEANRQIQEWKNKQ